MTTTLDAGSGQKGTAGALLRDWRQRRRRSQLDLALDTGVSARHLSFVETGRAQPSPELLLALAEQLQMPLRERNALANAAAGGLAAALPPELAGPPMNVFRACLHPDGLATATLNFADWAGYLLGHLHRLSLVTADPAVAELAGEVSRYPTVTALGDWHSAARQQPPAALLVPWQLELVGARLSLFSTLTTFAAPRDVTLAELAVELFYPADEQTAAVLRGGGQAEPG